MFKRHLNDGIPNWHKAINAPALEYTMYSKTTVFSLHLDFAVLECGNFTAF